MTDRKVTFGRIFWPSFWAALIVSVLGLIIWLIVISGIISSFETESGMSVKDKTILHMKLDGEIGEKSKSNFDPMSFSMNHVAGLADILHGLEAAKTDEKIKGIFIEIDNLSCGFATAKEIRDAINDFETSGKFAVAYNSGEVITQKEYYIASAADENYGFHSSTMEFLGLGAEMMFFKNALDNLDVEMQVIRGSDNDFKSAVEPFFRSDMSDSSRVQVERYMEGLWSDYRTDVAKDRKVSAEELNNIAENVLIQSVDDAVKYKLIDAAKYRDEVIDILSEKVKMAEGKELELMDFNKYAKKRFYQDQVLMKADDPNIAVILAEGGVAKTGDGLTSEDICKLFQDARANESVKTIVFRINSPGGSALASDEIWREVELTNKTKKVIVSMGDVAASGGYYIAAPASRIFADPNTITGSIGVFGVIPYIGAMMENKLGLTFDRAATNKHSIMSLNRKLSDEETAIIQKGVDDIYLQFKQRVAAGRGMTVEQVNVVGRGRVWTGRDALRVGLVDELGGLKDAIAYSAKEAGIKDQKVLYYPLVKEDKFGEILEKLEESENIKTSTKAEIPQSLVHYYNQLKKLESYQGMQMRMPYEITIN